MMTYQEKILNESSIDSLNSEAFLIPMKVQQMNQTLPIYNIYKNVRVTSEIQSFE